MDMGTEGMDSHGREQAETIDRECTTSQTVRHQLEALPHTPWARQWQEVGVELDVDANHGIKSSEVRRRRRSYGPNCMPRAQRKSLLSILINQFRSVVVLLLAVAGAVSFAFGETVEGFAIAAVVAVNAMIGFLTEVRATRSMEALLRLGVVRTAVRRDGSVSRVVAQELVAGDIVIIEAGDIIPADLRLLNASKLQIDESALTGESVPVEKQLEPIPADTHLAERTCMAYKGTAVSRGSGEGVVVATGAATELGLVAALTAATESSATPLERRLDQLGHRMVWLTLIVAGIVAVSGILSGRDALLMVETAIALAVATIPEGLPIVSTMALARGMLRMAKRNALVARLAAVETLGATSVICTDKTGTLTENRMSVQALTLPSGQIEIRRDQSDSGFFRRSGHTVDPLDDLAIREALETAVLCSGASLRVTADGEIEEAVGDPMEIALLLAGHRGGVSRDELLAAHPEVREVAFDSESKLMATYHVWDDAYRVTVKGAPEPVLRACTEFRDGEATGRMDADTLARWQERNAQMAAQGLRVLALATKIISTPDAAPYEALVFLGLVGLLDPPRDDVPAAIEKCQRAGIRIIMVTGDQAGTARNVADAVRLTGDEQIVVGEGTDLEDVARLDADAQERLRATNVFARVSPAQKLNLIELHQQAGAVVAMTGDGVNDAPALRKADIGVAMGRRGTEVAREAADIVLMDDRFATIVFAIEQGRVIFQNIRRFVAYLLSCNVAEVLVVAAAFILNWSLPILPLQILFLNLVTDVFPALALGAGEGEGAIMHRAPRPHDEPIMPRAHWVGVGAYGALIAAAVLAALQFAQHSLGLEEAEAVTISFLTLAFAQLWHVFNMRAPGSHPLNNDVTRNGYVWGALVLCSGLLLLATYIPAVASVLRLVPPDATGWATALALSAVPLAIGQAIKLSTRFTHQ